MIAETYGNAKVQPVVKSKCSRCLIYVTFYNIADVVKNTVESLNIELHDFSPYSQNLNTIVRLCKS